MSLSWVLGKSAALGPANCNVAVDGPGYRTAHVDQILFGIDLDDQQVLGRDSIAAHPAGGAHPREHPRRIGRRADRTGSAVVHRTVGVFAAAETVALDDSLKTLALAGPDHVHVLLF